MNTRQGRILFAIALMLLAAFSTTLTAIGWEIMEEWQCVATAAASGSVWCIAIATLLIK